MVKPFWWNWILICNAVSFGRTLSICQLPQEPLCRQNDTEYRGTELMQEPLGTVTSFNECALYCMWSKGCRGLSFTEDKEGTCSLLSDVTTCDTKEGYVSAANCYHTQTGDLYEWKIFPEGLMVALNGSYAIKRDSNLTLSCSIPDLDQLILWDKPYRWFKRPADVKKRELLEETGLTLVLDPVQVTDSAFYSCEITIFSSITIGSPEQFLSVVYLDDTFKRAPSMATFLETDEYIVLKCEPPSSLPPAVVDWRKGSPTEFERISDVENLNFLIMDGDLVILYPTSDVVKGNYFCTARNMMLDEVETTAPVNVRLESSDNNGKSIKDKKNDLPKNFGTLKSLLTGSSIDSKTITKTGKDGVWLEDAMIFRCVFVENIGVKISWEWDSVKEGDSVMSVTEEEEGVYLMEGEQVLMLSPDKIRELQSSGVEGVTCTKGGDKPEKVKIALPPQAQNIKGIIEKTVMLNLDLDMDLLNNTIGNLFQDEDMTSTMGDSVVSAVISNPSTSPGTGAANLQYIAIKGEPCEDYIYTTLRDDVLLKGGKFGTRYTVRCPVRGTLTGHCSLASPNVISWDIHMTSDCNLNKIPAPILDSFAILPGQMGQIQLIQNTRIFTIDTLMSALEENVDYYYADANRLNSVLNVLADIDTSADVTITVKSRAKQLEVEYMEYLEWDHDNVKSNSGSKVSKLLWSVAFPLQEPAILAFSSAQGGNETEIAIGLPTGLNDILDGSLPFLISLYHDPIYFTVMQGIKDRGYASKVVDIEPPKQLSNLTSDQEITIGIALPDAEHYILNNETIPICYWFDVEDSTWKTDGVTTLGFNDEHLLECATSHLTAFSILVSSNPLTGIHGEILSYLTNVCGGMSCLALLLTLIALIPFKEIRRSHTTKIHICLTATLLLAMLLFLGGIERTENPLVCEAIAISLHYLWLTAFMWTIVEAYNLYLLFIRILSAHSSSFICKLAVPALMVPAMVVGLTAGLSYESYTHHQYCSLGGNMVYYAFVIPVGVAFLINGGIFIAVISKIFKKGRYQHFEGKAQKILSQMKAISTLSCVLGLTWIFGFLTFHHRADVVFHYLFAICNTLQGLIIFVCHCVIKPDVRQKWLYVLCNVGYDTKSGHNSRSTTPTKSRLNLLAGFFQKRNSSSTLSTTVTKLSLTKQLTRQRTNSRDSMAAGMRNAHVLSKKASLEPLSEKDSASTSNSNTSNRDQESAKMVLRPMLSSHSAGGEVVCWNDITSADLTPPGEISPLGLAGQHFSPPPGSRRAHPRKVISSETRLREVLAAFVPAQNGSGQVTLHNGKEMSAISKQRVELATLQTTTTSRQFQKTDCQNFKELKLEDRMLQLSKSPDSRPCSSDSGARSTSPFHHYTNRRKVSPVPPKQKLGMDYNVEGIPKSSTPRHITTPITAKLAQLEEWMF